MSKPEVIRYVQSQMATTVDRLKVHTHKSSSSTWMHPRRHIYILLEKYINDFKHRVSNSRFVVISGLRGVGKTTVLSQICTSVLTNKKDDQEVLFLSLIEPVQILGFSLAELLNAYESIIGDVLERTKKQIYIFIDEVQKDPKWAITLHSLFEKNNNVFICCTGSSAVLLQANADIARRARFEKLPPLSFPEYQMLKSNLFPISGLKNDLDNAVYWSRTAQAIHEKVTALLPNLRKYWSKVVRTDIDHFLRVGTLPFCFIYKNDEEIFDAILNMLDNVIRKDLVEFGRFDTDTLGCVKRLLYLLAWNDTTSVHKLEELLGIKRVTIMNLLDALEQTEILIRVSAFGSATTAARKPTKYLFMSPAIRMAFLRMSGNADTYATHRGKLFEDIIGAHLFREIQMRNKGKIHYDSTQGGADFVVQIGENKRIAIEVGSGKKDASQVLKTMKDKSCDYGIVFSETDLMFDERNKVVYIPLAIMLLG